MNFYQKLKQHIYWRKFNVVDYAIFKMPLTKIDYFVIAVLVIAGLAWFIWHLNDTLSAQLAAKTAQASHMCQLAQTNALNARKSEMALVSLLNGSIIENGKILTYCKLNAAGDCK